MTSNAAQADMNTDRRTLTRATLEAMRFIALDRMTEGELPASISASFGMHWAWADKVWMNARGRGKDKCVVQRRKASGRRRRTLTKARERQVFRWVNRKKPRQYGFDFGPRTRWVVVDPVTQRFGVMRSLPSVCALLTRVGLTPQKPLQRPYQRDPEAITRWKWEIYPTIARQAKRTESDIYFSGESGFRTDAVHRKTWRAKGHTLVADDASGQRQGVSAASAVSAKAAFWFITYKGGVNGDLFVTLLRCQKRGQCEPLQLIVDNLRAHKARATKTYVDRLKGKLSLHFMSGYAPELNPDEPVWNRTKVRWQRSLPAACRRMYETSHPISIGQHGSAAVPDLLVLQASKCCLYF